MIGRHTIVHKTKHGETIHEAGAIHIKKHGEMHGKKTHGTMELMQAIGAIPQAPVLDGMQERVGITTLTTHTLKDITQRMLHNQTSI